MADIGKMWFEMGVRDNITDQMKQAIQASEDLGKTIDNITKNADKLTQALYKIANVRERITKATDTARNLGFDTSRLEEGIRRLNEFEMKLRTISAQDFKNESTAVSKELNAEYREMVRSLSQAAREQEKLNNAQMKGTAKAEAQAQREAAQAALANVQAQEKLISKFDQLTEAGKRSNGVMDQMKAQLFTYASFAGISKLLHDVITIGGEFEKQHIALKSILGDAQEADTMFSQIKSLAVESPFSFRELTTYTKQLAAFNIPYNELYDTSKRLADMSAGLGVDMNRLILAYGQVRSASVLRGQELRQFTEAGIPMVQALADKFTELNGKVTTTGDVFKLITQRAVPFEMVKDVLWDMTNEGGKFYNMQYVLADTLSGKWSNLRDAWEIMLSDFAKGESISGKVLKGMVGGITELIKGMNTLMPIVGSFAATWSGMKVFKWGTNLWNGGLNNTKNTFKAAKLNMARDIAQKRYMQGEEALSATERRILATKNEITRADYRALAASGRLNALELQRLFSQGKIGAAQIRHLATMKLITAEEEKQILKGNAMTLVWGKMKAGMGSLFTAGNAWMVGITAAISIALHFYEKSQEYAQAAENMAQSAQSRYQEMKTVVDAQAKGAPTGNDDYKSQIDQMKELLSQYDKNYAAAMQEADAQESLAGKYAVLKGELETVTAAYKDAKDNKETFEDLENSTDGLFTDPMKENMDEWLEANADVQKSLNKLNKEGIEGLDKALADFANRMPGYRDKIFGKDGKQLSALEGLENIVNTAGTKEELQKLMNDFFQRYNKNGTVNQNSLWWKLSQHEREAFSNYIEEAHDRIDSYKDLESQIEQVADKVADDTARHFDLTRVQFDELVRNGYKTQDKNLQDKIGENGRNAKAYIANYFNTMMSSIGSYGKELEQYVDAHTFQLRFHYRISETYSQGDTLFGNARSAWNAINKNKGPLKSDVGAKGFTKKDIEDAFGPSGTDVVNARKKLSERIQEQEKLVKELKMTRSATKGQIKAAQDTLSTMNSQWSAMFTDDPETVNKSSGLQKETTHSGSRTDKVLKSLKERVQLYKKFYSEYQENVKLYGAGAIDKLKAGGNYGTVFGWKLTDVTDFEKSMRELGGTLKQTTEERRNFADSMKGDIQAEARKKETEAIKDANDALKTQLDLLAEQYDTYKKIYELTGDGTGAAGIAFGGNMGSPTLKAAYESKLQQGLGSTSGVTAQQALAMPRNEFVAQYGEAKGMTVLYDAWHRNEEKIKKESYDLMVDILKNHRTLEQQIADENREYERQLELIKNNKGLTDDMRSRAEQGLKESHDQKQSKLQLEQFKKQSDWVTVFDDLNRVSTGTIRNMMGLIDTESRNAGLAPEDVKTLRDALEKLRDELARRSPIEMMASGASRSQAINSLLAKDKSDEFVFQDGSGKQYGLNDGVYTRHQMESEGSSATQDFVNGINGLSELFNACAEALDPVVDLFEEMGNTGISKVVGGGQKALGAAASTAGALSTLGSSLGGAGGAMGALGGALGKAGPYGAMAAAALSIGSQLVGKFGFGASANKKWQEQNKYLKSMQGTLKDINGNLKTQVSSSYGSQSQIAGKEIGKNLRTEASEVRETYSAWKDAHTLHKGHRNRMYLGLDEGKINSFLRANGYTGEKITADNIQVLGGKWLEQIRNNYAGMWARIPDDAKELLNRLIEIEGEQGEINKNAKDMVEALSGLKLDTLKSDYANLLNDLNSSNYQFAKKLEDYLRNAIISGFINDVYRTQIEELIAYANKAMSTSDTNSVIRNDRGEIISYLDAAENAELKKRQNTLSTDMRRDLDILKTALGWSNGDSSSLTNIGTSITEDTADLLLSYVNAIRADESVSLKYIRQYVEELCPMGNNLLAQQVALQKSIEANTRRSADNSDKIISYMDAVIKGTKKLHIT